MPNLVIEKGARKDCDRSGSSITRPRIVKLTRFVERSRLYFSLRKFSYILDMCFLFIFVFIFITL